MWGDDTGGAGKGKHIWEVELDDKWRDVRKKETKGSAHSGFIPIFLYSLCSLSLLFSPLGAERSSHLWQLILWESSWQTAYRLSIRLFLVPKRRVKNGGQYLFIWCSLPVLGCTILYEDICVECSGHEVRSLTWPLLCIWFFCRQICLGSVWVFWMFAFRRCFCSSALSVIISSHQQPRSQCEVTLHSNTCTVLGSLLSNWWSMCIYYYHQEPF